MPDVRVAEMPCKSLKYNTPTAAHLAPLYPAILRLLLSAPTCAPSMLRCRSP